MRTESDDATASATRDAEATSRRRFDFRLIIGLTLSFLFVVGVLALAIIRSDDDGCSSWEEQVHELSQALTRHRLATGESRIVALDGLETLELPCAKVDASRDACSSAYRHLLLAEREQDRAKTALRDIERVIDGLDDRLQSVARRRLVENESTAAIADALDITREEAEERLQRALVKIGPDQLNQLHGQFELAVKTSAEHVKSGARDNKRCDESFKRLIEAGQAR